MTQGIGKGSYLDMNGDEVWTDAQFQAKKRSEAALTVDRERQSDLQTIMIGHLLQWRAATASELAEAQSIMTSTLAAYDHMLDAQADYALRGQAQAVEAAQARLLQPLNPDDPNDATDRAAAQATVDAATPDVMAVVTFRNRYPPPPSPT
jgi:regulator of sirC expression with transglutaminase-like and TPR domain